MSLPHIEVCICTCERPAMLDRLLRGLARQETAGRFTFSAIVVDNGAGESARSVVERSIRENGLSAVYDLEPERNIAMVRNRALSHCGHELAAFVDDDEFPAADWLLHLFLALDRFQVAGVLGPVKPHFDQEPPAWIRKGRFYERPDHPTGFALSWEECRTGNVLFRRSILDPAVPPFRPEFGSGGEDQDFFQRLIRKGHRFVWCTEAVVFETVPPSRWSRRFLLSRALLRGKNSIRHSEGRWCNLAKSLVAVPVYVLALPVLGVAGQHYFMRYLVKLTDHVGRLLAAVRLNPAGPRPM